jgi:hypothetical protein
MVEAPPVPVTPTDPAEEFERATQEMFEQFGLAAGEGVAASVGGLIAVVLFGVFVYAVIAGIIALLIYLPYRKVPPAFRKMSPPAVFLMMIPIFGYVWNFVATARVSDSFKAYFDSVGDTSVGDAGKSLGLWFSICVVASVALGLTFILACVSPLASIAALVLIIIYIVKLFDMAGRIDSSPPQNGTASDPAPAPGPAPVP